MEQVAILLALAFTANKVTTVIKAATAGAWRDVITQCVVWAAAIGMLILAAEADITQNMLIPGFTEPLSEMNIWSVVMLGLVAGSTGSVVYDFKAAIDSTDSANEPNGILAAHPE